MGGWTVQTGLRVRHIEIRVKTVSRNDGAPLPGWRSPGRGVRRAGDPGARGTLPARLQVPGRRASPGLYNKLQAHPANRGSGDDLLEVVHDAGIIRLNSEHAPDVNRKWLGDSIGWWKGDTLVVETKPGSAFACSIQPVTDFAEARTGRGSLNSIRHVPRSVRFEVEQCLAHHFSKDGFRRTTRIVW